MKLALTSCLCLMFLLQAGIASEKKPKTIKQMITELKKEAKDSLKSGTLKRATANYATENKVSLKVKEVVQTLGKKLDRHPAIDAYIKFQLSGYISYTRMKSEVSPKDIMKMITTAPAYQQLPPPPNQLLALIEAADGASTKEKNKYDLAMKAYTKYKSMPQVKAAALNNQIIGLYNEKLAQMIPRDTALRYYFKVKNSNDRLALGDETVFGKKTKATSFFLGFSRVKDASPQLIAMIHSEIDRMGTFGKIVLKPPTAKKDKYTAGYAKPKVLKTSDLKKALDDQIATMKQRANR